MVGEYFTEGMILCEDSINMSRVAWVANSTEKAECFSW